MDLNLGAETEQRLRSLADASGASVEDYLRQVIEEKSSLYSSSRLGAGEWAQQFEEWADSFPEAPPIPDEALSRVNFYPDRW
jgi:hypothetical protein